MALDFVEINEKSIWEDFLEGCEEKTFLNSFAWADFNERLQNKVWRFGLVENNNLLAIFLAVKILAKRGSFIFLPHCPVFSESLRSREEEGLSAILSKLKEIGKKERIDFLRFAPLWPDDSKNRLLFKKLGFRLAPLHIHPEVTWELDISGSEDELLKGMRKTTRYLVRSALKNKDLFAIESEKLDDLKDFYQLYLETARRQKFVPFSYDYLEKEFLSFLPEKEIIVLNIKHQGNLLAGGIFIFWQGIGFYHHGASLPSKIPAVYLLIWEAIKRAKERGCKKFNFWGITLKKNHPWEGLTFFKQGFGGRVKQYVPTQDFVLTKRYWINFLIEKLRKAKRRL